MTDLERSLLNIVQRDFPLEPRPFRTIGDRLGISEKKCIALLKRLSDVGILRAIRSVISWNKLGFSTLLIGLKVDPTHLDAVAGEINRIDGVTHNYARSGLLNLWFTLIYDNAEQKDMLFARLRHMEGVEDIREFRAEKTYKIGLVLDV
jgi:DNA-binding Lrp family transcriptional regulator